MNKEQVVDTITDANAEFVLAFLTAQFPFIQIGIVRFIVKYYLKKWLRPMVNEGTVFIAFKVIDTEQMQKWEHFDVAKERFRIALESGVPDAQSEIAFDNTFRDSIRLKP